MSRLDDFEFSVDGGVTDHRGRLDDSEAAAAAVLADPCAAFRAGVDQGLGAADNGDDDDDDEVVFIGSSGGGGGATLPHFSFSCADGGCEKCYCFVCDAPRRECGSWAGDHANAVNDADWLGKRTARRLGRGPAAPSVRRFDARSDGTRIPRRAPGVGARVDVGRGCACASCVAIRVWAAAPDANEPEFAPPALPGGWRGRQHLMDELDSRHSASLTYRVTTAGGEPAVVVSRLLARAPPPPGGAAAPARRPAARKPAAAASKTGFALSARSRAAVGLAPLRAAKPAAKRARPR